jgi:superfamily I DNA/RNA helicase/RecB family exonuclease
MNPTAPCYRLVRQPAPTAQPSRLDDAQRLVVSHSAGPLLVLAGPGTGKTTAIVEAVVHRITRRAIDPSRVLVLTFSRKAAAELRERITMRLGRTTREPLALTFHSYAYALVRREFGLAGEQPPTLLSGPEQLLEVRRLLRGEAEDGGGSWPERLRPALATRGFAAELRDFLLRAAERGLDGPALAGLGSQRGRDDWLAAGGFLRRYEARFDLAPVPAYDYAEIIRIAGALLGGADARGRERAAYDVVCVDEYQDTDPAQEELLHALAGDGRELIAVADPDQSIYGFRGADVRAVSRFPERFRGPDGGPARVVALGTCRRSGAVLLAASRRIAARLPATLAAENQGPERGHRGLLPLRTADPGQLRIVVAASISQEAAVIADTLRRAHLMESIAWSSMAVLVRSGTRQLPPLQRALAAAGIPVTVAGDELPLAAEPGTKPLLTLLGCALRPRTLDEEAAVEMLTGPLGGTDALGVRRLRRALRAATEEPPRPVAAIPASGATAQPPPAPPQPLADALREPRQLALAGMTAESAGPALAAARRLAELIVLARDTEGSPHDVLWAVWNASGLAAQWQQASAAGGSRGAAADADLDAVLALFAAAERFSARLPSGSPLLFLDSLAGQEIAGDTLAERAPRDDAVALMTAHRSKGLEWDLVVVAGVQEGSWPDLRTRGSLLSVDELVDTVAADGQPIAAADGARSASRTAGAATDGAASTERTVGAAADGARNASRTGGVAADGARSAGRTGGAATDGAVSTERTVGAAADGAPGVERTLGALNGAAGAGRHPGTTSAAAAALASRLLDEERRLFYVAVTRARRTLVVTAVGGEDGEERPSRFLAELAGGDIAAERAAEPGKRWLSLPALTAELRRAVADRELPAEVRQAAAVQLARLAAAGVRGAAPNQWYALTELSGPGPVTLGRVALSPSQVESFTRCGLRWLLESAAGAGTPSAAREFGIVIHAAAALAAEGVGDTEIAKRIDEAWQHLDFGSDWYRAKRREEAAQMIAKFLDWHRANPRQLVAAERELRLDAGQVRITGRVDRLERREDGSAVVVDLKTGSTPPPDDELGRHPQLGVYQLAVLLGGVADLGLTKPGGAELVQLGRAALAARARVQRQPALADDPDPGWARQLVDAVAEGMAASAFEARVNRGCRSCPVAACCPVNERGARVIP